MFTYNDALAWRAVPWTKPNAVCGGVTNYWATAPERMSDILDADVVIVGSGVAGAMTG